MVFVGILGGRFDQVDVEIDWGLRDLQTSYAGLLGGLPQGHPGQVAVPVGMAAGLEPAFQLAMEHEQDPSVRRIRH